jgi:hypothetical protein
MKIFDTMSGTSRISISRRLAFLSQFLWVLAEKDAVRIMKRGYNQDLLKLEKKNSLKRLVWVNLTDNSCSTRSFLIPRSVDS